MIDTLERHYDVSFPPGDNKALHCIRLNLDPVLSVHRPLAVYVSIYVATTLFNTVFMKWVWQFKPYGAPSLLWGGPVLQLHRSNSKTPIVFIHGIGAGLMCYLELIWHMTRMDRPFFCIELPFVSMHMVDDVPDADTMVDAIHDMLHHHGFHQAVFVGHSLGTAVASWIMSRKPDIIAGSVLIDPICFLLHYPHVAFNFIYRAPKQWMDYIMLYVASRELYISHYISRHFQWFQCIFFADRLNKDMTLNHQSPLKRATVYISMKDSLVPSALVAKYLNRERVDCRTMPDLPHAGFLVNWTWRKRILQQIDRIASDVDDEAIDLSLDL
ncbi:Alpha/Beta hydrolase protein [Gongronella butleri]|nr:Alpha/Beta hydrolase protein [Gongronella butleri]